MVSQTVEYIGNQQTLMEVIERIKKASAIALDIETINWWDRHAERVALVQLAFRDQDDLRSPIRVAVIDPLAAVDLGALRMLLELSMKTKVIHNASFDAVKLARHFSIYTSPIYDTMLAARRSGEKKCSLKAQVEAHLGIQMDKTEQRSDWGRRPLSNEQLNYAALDACCTLLLYEKQIARGLRGDYELPVRSLPPREQQTSLPLSDGKLRISSGKQSAADKSVLRTSTDLSPAGLALLGIISELNGRYSPEQLAVSVGSERIGLAGWIIDKMLGEDEEIEENTAKQEISSLCEQGYIQISLSRRLEATGDGSKVWQQNKPNR